MPIDSPTPQPDADHSGRIEVPSRDRSAFIAQGRTVAEADHQLAPTDQPPAYAGAGAYDGSKRAVEVRTRHSASYEGHYRSDGAFARELQDEVGISHDLT